MNTENRQYKDVSGTPCSLDWLVKNEPEWAANQIRHRDKLEIENIGYGYAIQFLRRQCGLDNTSTDCREISIYIGELQKRAAAMPNAPDEPHAKNL